MVQVGIVGASGFTGAELLRLVRRPPRPRRAGGHRRHAGRHRASPTSTRAWPRPTRDLVFSAYDPAAVDGLDLVFLGLPHGASQAIVPELRRQGRPPRRPGRRLPAPGPGPLPAVVRRGAHRARAARPTSPTACPSCSGTRSVARDHVATPGCYPTAALARPGAARAGRGLVETDGDHRRRRLRACPAPAGRPSRTPRSARSTRTSPPTGSSTTGTRPRWSRCSAPPCCSRPTSRR